MTDRAAEHRGAFASKTLLKQGETAEGPLRALHEAAGTQAHKTQQQQQPFDSSQPVNQKQLNDGKLDSFLRLAESCAKGGKGG